MIDFGYGVALGPLRHENTWHYFKARNDQRVWKWCRQFDLLTEDGHEAWVHNVQINPKIRMYELLPNGLQRPVGVAGLTDIDHVNQRAEFSLYVFPDEQGQRFGKLGLQTLVSHGFWNLNLNRIWGETFDQNPAAKIFEGLGFEKEGTRKDFYFREGKFIDAHLYSVGRAQWFKRS
jgi:RimJ/RimL family protein N-acetyltransferase